MNKGFKSHFMYSQIYMSVHLSRQVWHAYFNQEEERSRLGCGHIRRVRAD